MCICSCMMKLWRFTQKIKMVVGEGNAASRAGVRITFFACLFCVFPFLPGVGKLDFYVCSIAF